MSATQDALDHQLARVLQLVRERTDHTDEKMLAGEIAVAADGNAALIGYAIDEVTYFEAGGELIEKQHDGYERIDVDGLRHSWRPPHEGAENN
jgi:hypothetical protein